MSMHTEDRAKGLPDAAAADKVVAGLVDHRQALDTGADRARTGNLAEELANLAVAAVAEHLVAAMEAGQIVVAADTGPDFGRAADKVIDRAPDLPAR
jgi:hypothetical protein